MKLTVLLLTCFLMLSACANTWQGAGRDIEQAGQKMQGRR